MIETALVGVGAIGSMVVKAIVEDYPWIDLVAAIDTAPDKVGRDVGEVAGLDQDLGVTVEGRLEEVLDETLPDVVIVTTSSRLRDVYGQVMAGVAVGANVISTSEELAYPWIIDPAASRRLDNAARWTNVSVLGAGVNPGFLMDALPTFLTLPCTRVERVMVTRVIDASKRRGPFQKKIGAGMTPEEFREAIGSGAISGHVGLEQSAYLIAESLGWKPVKLSVAPPEPVLADRTIETDYVRVDPGKVAGLRQSLRLEADGGREVKLTFEAYVGAEDERDEYEIDGRPPIRAAIRPCVQGDWGTVGVLLNLVPSLLEAEPGLITVVDLLPRRPLL